MTTTFFIIMFLFYLFSIYKDNTTTYYCDPYDIDDVSPWKNARFFSATLAILSFVIIIITLSSLYLSDDPEIIRISKFLLYFGK